ncbi:unnamed protein product [Nesidiocoris tenuis]|uniref:Uncharacterized protein n=1 Tax=Nesidiocoris tenuis TaxID=355587 RepID=A0A6H5GQD5_9HEMI|nr:unnamed protein product [Nesidiocoris tenuis]
MKPMPSRFETSKSARTKFSRESMEQLVLCKRTCDIKLLEGWDACNCPNLYKSKLFVARSEPKDILVDDPLASKEFLKYQADWERVMDMEAKEFKETCDIPGSRNATQQQLAVKVSEPMEIDSPSNGTNASKNETALSATVHLPVAQPQQPTTYIVTTPRPMATQFIPAPLVVTQISSPGVAQIVVSQPVVTQPVVSTPMNPIWVLPNVESSVNSKEPAKPLVSANSSAQAKEEKPVRRLLPC